MSTPEETMIDICALSDLSVERGVAALLEGTQVAVFRLDDDTVRVCQQKDPYSGANVLSRGLVGSHEIAGAERTAPRVTPTLASPMYKQVWDLDTGAVLDAGGGEALPLAVHGAVVREGRVLVAPAPRPTAAADGARS